HRKSPIASPEQRLEMVRCAIDDEPALKVDDCEIARKGPSYFIDTLKILRQTFSQTPLCLIMGIDAFLGFPSWHCYQEILSLTHLVIAHRPQYHIPSSGIITLLLKERLKHNPIALHESLGGYIVLHPVTS